MSHKLLNNGQQIYFIHKTLMSDHCCKNQSSIFSREPDIWIMWDSVLFWNILYNFNGKLGLEVVKKSFVNYYFYSILSILILISKLIPISILILISIFHFISFFYHYFYSDFYSYSYCYCYSIVILISSSYLSISILISFTILISIFFSILIE